MSEFTHDGTLFGLLTVIDLLLQNHIHPTHIHSHETTTPDLFRSTRHVKTDESRAQLLGERIRSEISENAHDHLVYAFLSERPESDLALFHYIRMGFERGADVDRFRSEPWVYTVHSLSRKMAREVHRMQGFLRFDKLMDGTYYAAMEPDFFILPLLAPYFCNRLQDQDWVIHDVRRGTAAMYNQTDCIICDLQVSQPLHLAKGEDTFRKLWQLYFDSIGIAHRTNSRLQQQLMPKKYWPHLIEKRPRLH